MTLSGVIKHTAQLARNSGASVDARAHLSVVAISWADGECFMQGADADQFITAVRLLSEAAPDVTIEDCELCEAWPYIENLSN